MAPMLTKIAFLFAAAFGTSQVAADRLNKPIIEPRFQGLDVGLWGALPNVWSTEERWGWGCAFFPFPIPKFLA